MMRGKDLSPDFRERLMLAVTAVNGCRYCSYAHTRAALRSGIDEGEVSALLGSDLAGAPPSQVTALLYVQHWAETNGNPDPDAAERLVKEYGESQARQIELALRLIRTGNLTGNTFDYLRFRLSRGRLGLKH